MAERLKYNDLRMLVLLLIYEAIASDKHEHLTEQEIKTYFGNLASRSFVSNAIQANYGQEYIFFSSTPDGSVYWNLSEKGILAAENAIDSEPDEYDFIRELLSSNPDSTAFGSNETDSSESEPGTNITYSEFERSLLVALYRKSNSDGLNLYKLKALADDAGLVYKTGWVREAANYFDSRDLALISNAMGGDEAPAAKISSEGLKVAEEILASELEDRPIEQKVSTINASDLNF